MANDYYLENPVDLKEAINIDDLQDPSKGVLFEVNNQGDGNPESAETTNTGMFDGEDVYANILRVDDETSVICEREGLDTFEAMQRRMEDITDAQDCGVYKMIMKRGAGSLVPPEALVRIHYNAYHEMEAEPFDSTRLRHQVEKFRLGIGSQVEGLHVAVASMKKGERSRFLFKPEYFYGKMGCPPRIPPDCTVLFDIELLSFVEREGVDDYHEMTEEERKQLSFDFVCKVAKAEREEGNQLYNSCMYNKAWSRYKTTARILEEHPLRSEREEEQQKKLLVRVYVNMALCCQKLKQNGITITYCHKALALDPTNVKATYHKAQALHFMSEFEDARKWYLKAQRLDASNRAITTALTKLDQDVKKFSIQSENYAQMCQRMFTSSVNDEADESRETESKQTKKPAEEAVEECSAQFRATVEEKIEEFFKNPDIVAMPFPEQTLTVPEISCIVEVAEKFGMIVQRRGTGNGARMVIIKRKSQLQFDN